MLMLLPIVALLEQTTQRKWVRPFYWFLFVGVLYRALSTHSRGGFLACLGLGIAYWLCSRQKLRVLLSTGVVIAIVLPALPDVYWSRIQTIQTYEEEEETSALGRLHFWAVAIEMAKANPFLGVGYQCYNPSYNKYDFSYGEYGKSRSVHSSFLASLAELGYLGFVLFSLIIFGAFRNCHYVHRHSKDGLVFLELNQSATAIEMALIVFLIGGSFVIFQYNEMLWHYIGLSVALKGSQIKYC
jgi:probable O-glycosylation ligase (exosortase A-associated)